jgi:hypothetical protein
MKKIPLMRMTAIESKMGRFMRAPDHDAGTGGGDSGQTQNNQGGNSGDDAGTGDSDQNNTGQQAVTDAFWDDPSDAAAGDNSAGNGDSSGGDRETEARNFGQQLQAEIQGIKFDGGFTPELVAEMADGKFENSNKMMADMSRAAAQQGVMLAAKVMGQYGKALREEFQGMIEEKLGNRDNNKTLLEEFPQAASNPKLKPMIRTTFEQAMKHTKGNRAAALDMTRSMLAETAKVLGTDLELTSPPGGSGDNPPSDNGDFLAELLGRK